MSNEPLSPGPVQRVVGRIKCFMNFISYRIYRTVLAVIIMFLCLILNIAQVLNDLIESTYLHLVKETYMDALDILREMYPPNPEGSLGGTEDAVTSQPLSSAAQVNPLVGQTFNNQEKNL